MGKVVTRNTAQKLEHNCSKTQNAISTYWDHTIIS